MKPKIGSNIYIENCPHILALNNTLVEVRAVNGHTITVFSSTHGNIILGKEVKWHKCTNEILAQMSEKIIEELEEKLVEEKVKLDRLKNYKSDDHYLAVKIDELMKTDSIDAKAEIIKLIRNMNKYT